MTVYLVGAGPGDPGLLTVRAAQLLAQAEVVLHDRLVEPAVLELISPEALRIDVGKQAGRSEGAEQKVINELLIEHGRTAGIVVRLKGGDPYVFGRGGEEALALEEAGVDYEVVPGVSSVNAAPASAGVPLTLRGYTSSVLIATGHDADQDVVGAPSPLERLAETDATLVVVMGTANRVAIAERLLAAGRPADTPVLAVTEATTARQRSLRCTLGELLTTTIEGPATLVIGAVAALDLASYERRPLHGWQVVVTRSETDRSSMADRLSSLGAGVIALATIAIGPAPDGGSGLRRALANLQAFEWFVCSSAHGADALMATVRDARALASVKVAAIGDATGAALRRQGIEADLVATQFSADGLISAFPRPHSASRGVLVLGSNRSRPTLVEGLRHVGWSVEGIIAYETSTPPLNSNQVAQIRGADAALFASPSAFSGFLETAGRAALPPVVVTIGPVTSAAVVASGVEVSAEADVHTAEGLVDSLLAYVAASRKHC